MTNFDRSEPEWQRLEAPLLDTDEIFARCAAQHGLTLWSNYKLWPERSLVWGDGVYRLIQLYLADDVLLTFNLWLHASIIRPPFGFSEQRYLIQAQRMETFIASLPSLLEEAVTIVNPWNPE